MEEGQLIVVNCTKEVQEIKALGSYFKFAVGAKKVMREHLARWIAEQKYEDGLIALPESFNDDEYMQSEAGQEQLKTLMENGLQKYLDGHTRRVNNLIVSRQKDLDQANIKIDVLKTATPGEKESIKILASYQNREEDTSAQELKEMKELLEKAKLG